MSRYTPEQIRNIAIIAHIDHGKTTLLDSLLDQASIFRSNEAVPERVMDSFDLEKERGITIYAKHTGIFYKDFKINIIDTPGHADFSGEVERILGMVNSVLLVVDAREGPMPQTRFVLSQALKIGLQPIVVLNKIDRPHADPDRVLNETFDLFVELGASDEQLDFPYIYASGLKGFAKNSVDETSTTMEPLFELIVKEVPQPPGSIDLPFLMQASTVGYDEFVGRQATGRILEGKISKNDLFTLVNEHGEHSKHKAVKVESYLGLKKVELDEASVGDIVSISGAPEVNIGNTLCDPNEIKQLPPIPLSEPTLSMDFMPNTGPFVGKDGKHVTMNKIKDRLLKEKRANITLRIEEVEGREDAMRVCGRGELHIAVLIEAMRRESYEFMISKPQVLLKYEGDKKLEPIELCHIEVPETYSGAIIEELNKRKGEMRHLETNEHGLSKLEFLIPTRGLIGYRNEFLTVTKGTGVLTSVFDSFAEYKGAIPSRKNGALVSICKGKVTAYAAFDLQSRGVLFVKPGDEVYEGMIVGQHNRDNDLNVNIAREKKLTNVRASGSDETITLTPPRVHKLETAIDFIQNDEYVEVTPNLIRLRKQYLTENERKRKK